MPLPAHRGPGCSPAARSSSSLGRIDPDTHLKQKTFRALVHVLYQALVYIVTMQRTFENLLPIRNGMRLYSEVLSGGARMAIAAARPRFVPKRNGMRVGSCPPPLDASTTAGKVSAQPSRKRRVEVCSYRPYMYACMHVCMYLCMYVCMYIRIYIYVYTYILHPNQSTYILRPNQSTHFVYKGGKKISTSRVRGHNAHTL